MTNEEILEEWFHTSNLPTQVSLVPENLCVAADLVSEYKRLVRLARLAGVEEGATKQREHDIGRIKNIVHRFKKYGPVDFQDVFLDLDWSKNIGNIATEEAIRHQAEGTKEGEEC